MDIFVLCNLVTTLRSTGFNVKKFYILPSQFIYVFCMDLGTNSDYFPVGNISAWFHTCSLRGTN
jgi:hypothetical protein